MSMRSLVAAAAALLGATVLAGGVLQEQPAVDWSKVTVNRSRDWIFVQGPNKERLGYFEPKPLGKGLGEKVKVTVVADGLEIDMREAFKAGALFIRFRTADWDLKKIAGRDVLFLADWTGVQTGRPAEFAIVPEGADADKRHWWKPMPKQRVVKGRRRYESSVIVPEDLRHLHTRFDFTAAGDGVVRFHGIKVGRYAELAEEEEPAPGEPKLLFHASFDGTLAAKAAGGTAEPLESNGLEFVPGRSGQAVRFREETASKLVYAADGRINPARGTFSCWVRREWPEKVRPGFRDGERYHAHFRPVFSLSDGKEPDPGDGALRLWWRADHLRYDRFDANEDFGVLPLNRIPGKPDDWLYLTLVWNERGTRMHLNGGKGKSLSDSATPVHGVLDRPGRYAFSEGWLKELPHLMIGCGTARRDCPFAGLIDEVKIWSEAMTAAEVRRLYERESGVAVRPEGEVWNEPWRNPPAPPPPNPASLPPQGVAGVPAGMELVTDVKPAEIARGGDTNLFRSAGAWRTGTFDGLEYLEAGTNLWDRWTIRFNLDPTVPLWCFEVTYPEDRDRANDFVIQNSVYAHSDYCTDAGVEIGIEHPIAGRNAVKRYLYWTRDVAGARKGDLAFVAMTRMPGQPAAVSRIRVYAIRSGAIPAARVDEPAPVNGRRRHFALWFEDPAVMYDFGTMTEGARNADPKLMIDRIAAYMKYTGQDLFVYPGVWYAGLIGSDYQPRPHMSHYWKEVGRRFDRDGLSFVPSINQQWFPAMKLNVTRKSLGDGSLHSSPLSIHATGCPNWGGWHHTPTYYNIAHPDVQKALLDEIDALLRECRDFGSFKGVCLDLFNAICVPWWGSIEAGYNDYCIDAFEKAKGIRVPADRADPLRGKAYAAWLRANAYDAWVDWRCEVVTAFYAKAAQLVRAARPDLDLWINASPAWLSGSVKRDDLDRPDVTERMLREAGVDGARLAKIPNVTLGVMSMPAFWRDELHRLNGTQAAREKVWRLPETAGFYGAALKTAYPFANFHDSYYETAVGAPPGNGHHSGDGRLSGGWFRELTWRVTSFSASGREALRPYAKALKYGDLLAFGRGGFLVGTCGDEEVTAEFMRNFRALPAVKFTDVPGAGTEDVRVREATVDGRRWLYAVNTGAGEEKARLPAPFGEVALKPYELRAFPPLSR